MKPIFKNGDLLVFGQCSIDSLHKGDVIAFKNKKFAESNDLVVHRIISTNSGNLLTRGDNNPKPDRLPVTEKNLIGKVIAYERNGKRRRVTGGLRGLIQARVKYNFRRLIYQVYLKLKWLLPLKPAGNLLIKLSKSPVKKIQFSTAAGPVVKWIFRNRTIAYQYPDNKLQRTSFISQFLI